MRVFSGRWYPVSPPVSESPQLSGDSNVPTPGHVAAALPAITSSGVIIRSTEKSCSLGQVFIDHLQGVHGCHGDRIRADESGFVQERNLNIRVPGTLAEPYLFPIHRDAAADHEVDRLHVFHADFASEPGGYLFGCRFRRWPGIGQHRTAMYTSFPFASARARTGSWVLSGTAFTTCARCQTGNAASRSAASSAPTNAGMRP